MFGQTDNFQPRSFRSKLVYVILLFISVFLISELVTNLTEIEVEVKDRLLATDMDDIFSLPHDESNENQVYDRCKKF